MFVHLSVLYYCKFFNFPLNLTSNTVKEGKSKSKETFGQSVLTKEKNSTERTSGNHSSPKINGTTEIKEQKLKWFSICFSLSNSVAHISPLLPYIWVCKLNQFPHRGKKERKKGALLMKVMFCLDCPQNRSASRK